MSANIAEKKGSGKVIANFLIEQSETPRRISDSNEESDVPKKFASIIAAPLSPSSLFTFSQLQVEVIKI